MNQWTENENTLEREFIFKTFKEALAFVNKVGEVAERMQHHPTIFIHDYNKVTIATSTHDAGNTVTDKDYALADEIDALK